MNSKNFTKKALASIIAIASVFASAVPAVAADSSTSNVEETSNIETAKAELKTLIDKFNSVDENSNRKYTAEIITDSAIWTALSDAYYAAQDYYTQPTSTLEEVNACINTFTAAFEKADKFIADAEEAAKKAEDEANQSKVAGVKDEISKLLAGITVEEQDLFPSVWEVLNTAITNANTAINNDELVYSEAIEVKSTLESAISDATKNAEVKATVDEAKEKLGQTIDSINFNENTVNAELWTALQTAITDANTVLNNAEAVLTDVQSASDALNAAIEDVNNFINSTVTLTDLSNNIAIVGFGLQNTYTFKAKTTNVDSTGAIIIEPSLTDSEDQPVLIENVEDVDTVKILIPLTKSFDGVKKVYLYTLNDDKTVYTPFTEDLTKTVGISDGILSFETNKLTTIAMSRVALTSNGTIDSSGTAEIPTYSLSDASSNVEITSNNINFAGAKLSAIVDSTNNTRTTVELTITNSDNKSFNFGSNSASVSVPLSGRITDATKVYVYHVVNDTYTEVSNNLMFKRVAFSISDGGTYVVSSIKLNANGEADKNETITPICEKEATKPFTKTEFENILVQNSTQDIVINTDSGISFKFAKGSMHAIDDAVYDFRVNTANSYNDLTDPYETITKDNFVLYIDYKYEGDLPAMAEVTINVGTKYAGKTLYYSQVFDDHVVQVQRVVVDAKGNIVVSQDHCSDYVVTTESIVGSDISSDEDDIIESDTATTIKSKDYDISVTTKNVLPNGAKLSLSVVDIDENTIKYSDFGVTNGIGVYSNLKGKATVSIPLDEKFTGAEHVYVYVSDALTPIESEINNGYIVFDVNDITQLIAISTEKWTENATPAKGNMVNVTSTTLEDNDVTVTGMLPIGATLTTEKFDNDSNSFELSIIVKNAKGEVIAFNKENMSAQATFVLDEQYANADRLYVYAVSKKNQRIVYTNATYTPVEFSVTADGKININLNSFGTYVISTVELDENGNYVNMSEIDIAKTSLESYINKLEVNESDYTAESYAAYIKAIENAKNVIANDNATIDEVNTAKTAINTAISNLVKVDDTTSDNSTSDTSDDTTSDDTTSDDNNTGDVTNSDSTSDIIPGDSDSNVTSDPIEDNPNDTSNPNTGLVTTPIGITAAFSAIASIVGVIFSKKRK